MKPIANMNTSAHEKFLFIMDPAETLNLDTETSLLLMEELLSRGKLVYWLQAENLSLANGQPVGMVRSVHTVEPLTFSEPVLQNLNAFDAVLLRTDPPVDTRFLQLTLLLDHLEAHVIQFNAVKALRDFNEKLLPLRWPGFTPPTLISMSAEQIENFVFEQRQVVLKPLNDCSGRGISKIEWSENGDFRVNIKQAISDTQGGGRFVVAQRFLPGVKRGDKRVFLVNGEPVGMVNRLPRKGSYLANIHQGASCVRTQLSAREKHIIKTIAPFLIEQGIFLAGADFIDGYLTELNITSPSAVRQINAVTGKRVQRQIVQAMLASIAIRRSCCRDNNIAA